MAVGAVHVQPGAGSLGNRATGRVVCVGNAGDRRTVLRQTYEQSQLVPVDQLVHRALAGVNFTIQVTRSSADGRDDLVVLVAAFALVHVGRDELQVPFAAVVVTPGDVGFSAHDGAAGVAALLVPQIGHGHPALSLVDHQPRLDKLFTRRSVVQIACERERLDQYRADGKIKDVAVVVCGLGTGRQVHVMPRLGMVEKLCRSELVGDHTRVGHLVGQVCEQVVLGEQHRGPPRVNIDAYGHRNSLGLRRVLRINGRILPGLANGRGPVTAATDGDGPRAGH